MDDTLGAALEGRYKIDRELGAGGMATVFLARDLRHDRQVAIKVLKPELAAVIGAERFLREIKTIASLQHPHILGLIDSGQMNGTAYYVMPFIEGESLRDRLEREKQLPVSDAVRLATEIAGALDYAHRQGVIHRDVKPENILLHDRRALVADFGIALAVSKAGGTRMTETGMSLGTPQYMSPEQAMGERDIGPQSDVYSLGAVTYEMLVGEPPFTGPTAQAIVARIVTEEPRPLASRRHTIPPHVEAAVFTALEKLPPDRFASTQAFADALSSPGYTRPTEAARRPAATTRRLKIAAAGASLLALAATVAAVTAWLRPEDPRPVSRYAVAFPDSSAPNSAIVLSPDGSRLVYGRVDSVGNIQLWVKDRDRYEPSRIAGAENVAGFTISPDGQWVAFIRNQKLYKLAITGGLPVQLADSAFFAGAAWLDDGTIVYGSTRFSMMRVRDDGTGVTVIQERFGLRAPVFMRPLPDSRGVLFTLCNAACSEADLYAYDFAADSAIHLASGALQGWYLPTGHLVYVRQDGQLLAVPFDSDDMKMLGTPVTLLRGVSLLEWVVPVFAVSSSGTMMVRTGSGGGLSGASSLVWVDRSGSETPLDSTWTFEASQAEGNHGWSISPDGRRLLINFTTRSGDDVWTKELPRGSVARLSFDPQAEYRPRWTPDGESFTYIRRSEGNQASGTLLQRRADGRGATETLLQGVLEGFRTKDGWVIARVGGEIGGASRDIVGLLPGVDKTPRPLVANPAYHESAPAVSPDEKWLAYESDETGRSEVYIRPFPDTDTGKWQISEDGGQAPLWDRSGRELFFIDRNRRMVAATVRPGSSPVSWERRTLFQMSADLYLTNTGFYTPFDISHDGTRFLMMRPIRGRGSDDGVFLLVENWFEEVTAAAKKTR